MQRIMQNLQENLTTIQSQNIQMEQEFENEINKKNTNQKELGMIVRAINNIYTICQKHKSTNRKAQEVMDVKEGDQNYVHELTLRLEASKEVIEDLGKLASLDKATTSY